jgi:F-type H+-transporting ATPase subunit delta
LTDVPEKSAMKKPRQARRDARQLFRLCLADGLLDDGRVRQVVHRVGETTSRNRLVILSHFRRLVRLDCARRTATVESATPLPADLQAGIQAGLARAYGPGLNTSFAHSPPLIGGMRIKVGCDVYDGSVFGRLAALEARL